MLAMGGLQNVLRSFLQNGRPIAPRVISVGGALCHTNAAYGWGVALGFDHASALATIMQETEDPDAISLAYHARVWPEAKARWELSIQQDHARIRQWRGETPDSCDARATALRAVALAMMLDASVFRTVIRCSLLLDPADALLDPELLTGARAVIDRRGPIPAPPVPPTRKQFLAVLR